MSHIVSQCKTAEGIYSKPAVTTSAVLADMCSDRLVFSLSCKFMQQVYLQSHLISGSRRAEVWKKKRSVVMMFQGQLVRTYRIKVDQTWKRHVDLQRNVRWRKSFLFVMFLHSTVCGSDTRLGRLWQPIITTAHYNLEHYNAVKLCPLTYSSGTVFSKMLIWNYCNKLCFGSWTVSVLHPEGDGCAWIRQSYPQSEGLRGLKQRLLTIFFSRLNVAGYYYFCQMSTAGRPFDS